MRERVDELAECFTSTGMGTDTFKASSWTRGEVRIGMDGVGMDKAESLVVKLEFALESKTLSQSSCVDGAA